MKNLQRNFLFRFYSAKSDAEQTLILSGLFSMILVVFRVVYTGHSMFLFLVWNLFLAYIPFAISNWMSRKNLIAFKWKFIACFVAWLVFLPNAYYIITDLFHLDMNFGVPLWFDLALLLSFAWSGLLCGIISIRQMEKMIENILQKRTDLLFILPVMLLNGLGVYIGRYLRFNSWDVITNPLQLAGDIIYLFIHPIRNKVDWSMIVCYSLLLALIYYSVKRAGKQLNN